MRYFALAAALVFSGAANAQTGVFPPVDNLLAICVHTSDAELCEVTRNSFQADWDSARKGDYPAQRNVAFCLQTGCDGATIIDPVEACAWRMIIQATPVRKEPTEFSSYKQACSPLANHQRREALSRAEAMFGAVYDRQLPLEKLFTD